MNVIGGPGEHVQLTDRLAVVQWLRVFLAAAVAAVGLLDGDAGEVVPLVAAYLVLTAGVEIVRRRAPGLVHPTMSWMLLLDGVFLALHGRLDRGDPKLGDRPGDLRRFR